MSAPKRQVKVVVQGREYLVEVGDLDARPISATVNGQSLDVYVEESGTAAPSAIIKGESRPGEASPPVKRKPTPTQETTHTAGSHVTAPMPGDIVEILVKPGDRVSADQIVCSLEAMKMKNAIHSPRDGVIASVEVALGQAVSYGQVLVKFE